MARLSGLGGPGVSVCLLSFFLGFQGVVGKKVSHCTYILYIFLRITNIHNLCWQVVDQLDEERHKHAVDTAQGDDVTYMLEKQKGELLSLVSSSQLILLIQKLMPASAAESSWTWSETILVMAPNACPSMISAFQLRLAIIKRAIPRTYPSFPIDK